jgi:protocatechuate 3,4-dioxygenase, beta subunit
VPDRQRCFNLPMPNTLPRRHLLVAAVAGTLALPALASSRRALPQMGDGPFYPPKAWRTRWSDWDADLTQVRDGSRTAVARGAHLGLSLVLADANGRLVDGAECEIWQCDTLAHYRHPDVKRDEGRFDPGFQGFGAAVSDARGELALRTIRPVAYPGRTPHIHIKVRHASFGEWTSQLFVAGDAGNERDFLWRRLPAEGRAGLEMKLAAAPAGSGLAHACRHELMLPA